VTVLLVAGLFELLPELMTALTILVVPVVAILGSTAWLGMKLAAASRGDAGGGSDTMLNGARNPSPISEALKVLATVETKAAPRLRSTTLTTALVELDTERQAPRPPHLLAHFSLLSDGDIRCLNTEIRASELKPRRNTVNAPPAGL
jgi:hypothetical protein